MPASGIVPNAVSARRQPRNPISLRQVERVLSRSAAVFGLVFAAQTVPALIGQLDEAYPLWLWIVVPALFGWLLVTLGLSIAQVWVRGAHGTFAVLYLIALATWPLAVLPDAEVFHGIHWLNYLITVATGMAAIALSTVVAGAYLLAVPAVYALIRVTPAGGGASVQLALLEAVYAVLLGGVILILMTMLRSAAASVDAAQATAMDRYERAVRQHATEAERVEVDAIVHDSVLTTLISAARAYTSETKALAGVMAGKAIGHLRNAAFSVPPGDSAISLAGVSQRIASAAEELLSVAASVLQIESRSMPVYAAEAVCSAAIQAMVNSMQHAGEGTRWVEVHGLAEGGIEVVVGDTGRGFELDRVPAERLGVRVSIIERATNAGGTAVIRSAPGVGTVVTVRWPALEAAVAGSDSDEGDE